MKLPTSEEIAAFKATALAKFASDRAELVELDAPIDEAIVVAPFTLKTWKTFIDADRRDRDTARQQALVGQLLWPSLERVLELQKAWPLLAHLVTSRLYAKAGLTAAKPIATRLSLDAPPPAGITADKVKALFASHDGAVLWFIQLPTGPTLVMKAPLSDVLFAARAADQDAREKAEGIVAAMLPFALETIVDSSEPIESLLDRTPAIAEDLRVAFLKMGGEGVTVRSKSL